jgi:chromosome segregation and condensation protein ScpB
MNEQTFALEPAGAASSTGSRRPTGCGRPRRPPATGIPSPAATALRQRRGFLGISIREASRRTGVSHTVISEIEVGRRLPTVRTFERLRRGLGLEAPTEILLRAAEPVEASETEMVRLAACLWACGGRVTLADLAGALGVPAATARGQLSLVASRLAACGLALTDDGVEVHLGALAVAEPALRALGVTTTERRRAALSTEAVAVLGYVGWNRDATRRQLEVFRGEDCETLLGRLVDAGYLVAVRDDRGRRPNRYRPTELALEAFGVASLEELHRKLEPFLGPARTDAMTR